MLLLLLQLWQLACSLACLLKSQCEFVAQCFGVCYCYRRRSSHTATALQLAVHDDRLGRLAHTASTKQPASSSSRGNSRPAAARAKAATLTAAALHVPYRWLWLLRPAFSLHASLIAACSLLTLMRSSPLTQLARSCDSTLVRDSTFSSPPEMPCERSQ